MKKLLLKTMLLLCALVVGGVSSVWATDVTINFGTTAGYWAANNNDSYTDSDSRTWSRTFSANNAKSGQAGYSQFGNSSNTCTSLVFTATAGSDITVTAFSVTMAGASGGGSPTTGTIYLYKRTSGGTETQLATASVSGTDDVVCSISSSVAFSSTDILKVSYVGTAKAIRISSLSYSYTASGGGSDPSITLGTTSINVTKDAVDDGSITVTYDNLTDYDADVVFYKADGETQTDYDWITASINGEFNVAYLIDANTGSARTAYMKVYALGDEGEAYSDLITITQASGIDAPTFSTPAGAIAAGTKITLTQAAADEIRYTTDGTDPTKTTGTVYSTPIAITTATTLKAIAVKGSGVSAVASAAYTINVATPECNFASTGNYLAGAGLTLTSAGNTIYYNMTTNGSDPSTPTSSSTEYTGPISLSSGTVKIKAIAYDAYGNTSGVLTRTVYGKAPATLPFNWAGGGKSTLTAVTGVIGYNLGSDYANSHSPYMVKFDTDGDYIEIFTNAQPLKVSVGVKMISGASTSKITVQESTNGADFSDVEDLTISGAQNDILSLETTKDFASTTRVIKLLFDKGSDNVGVGPISISQRPESVVVGSAGYATFASDYALDFTGLSINAYIAKADGKTGVTFTQVYKVPANTGVLLYKDGGTGVTPVDVPVFNGTGADATTDNVFKVGTGAGVASTSGDLHNYILNIVDDKIGFYLAAGQTVATNRAYIQIDESTLVKGFIALDFDETDGIRSMDNGQLTMDNERTYRLDGTRVNGKLTKKGLYIRGGRKVVVR